MDLTSCVRGSQASDVVEALYRLLSEAQAICQERRSEDREPFFAPVYLIRDDHGQTRRFSCFSRDVSPGGIGLLHSMPVDLGNALLRIPLPRSGEEVVLAADLVWCRPCGEGWYLSGAKFLPPRSCE